MAHHLQLLFHMLLAFFKKWNLFVDEDVLAYELLSLAHLHMGCVYLATVV